MLIIIITYKLTHSLSHVNLFYTHTNRLGFAMSMQDYFKMFYSLLKFIISNNIECFLFSYLRFKHKLVFKNLFLVYIPGVINIILASHQTATTMNWWEPTIFFERQLRWSNTFFFFWGQIKCSLPILKEELIV